MATSVKLASAIAQILATKYQDFLVKSEALNWKIAEAIFTAYESMSHLKHQKQDKVSAILACLDSVDAKGNRSAVKSRGTIEGMIQACRARPALSNLSGLSAAETRKQISFSAANQMSGQALKAVDDKCETHPRGEIAEAVQTALATGPLSNGDARAIAKKFPVQRPRKASSVIKTNDPSILSDTAKITNTGSHLAMKAKAKMDPKATYEGVSTEYLVEYRRLLAEESKWATQAF